MDGKKPSFPEQERQYLLESIRYVHTVFLTDIESPDTLPLQRIKKGATWLVEEAQDNFAKVDFCREHRLEHAVIPEQHLQHIPSHERSTYTNEAVSTSQKKVLVTGCYDWFHSGHVRFFEEVSEFGDLYVVVGHDANIRLLKGSGHPMYKEDERRYMVSSIRYVKSALVSSGDGWLDAEPEIEIIKPDIYAVNEDGDVSEKRHYCDSHGIEYRVLTRTPRAGLPKRESTILRGF